MSFGGTNNRGPSIAELQRFIREKDTLVFMLANGEKIVGVLRWADESAFQILPTGQQPFTILRSAIVGYHKEGAGSQNSSSKTRAAVGAIEKAADVEKKVEGTVQTTGEPAAEIRADDIGS
jgi:hypothetical protein